MKFESFFPRPLQIMWNIEINFLSREIWIFNGRESQARGEKIESFKEIGHLAPNKKQQTNRRARVNSLYFMPIRCILRFSIKAFASFETWSDFRSHVVVWFVDSVLGYFWEGLAAVLCWCSTWFICTDRYWKKGEKEKKHSSWLSRDQLDQGFEPGINFESILYLFKSMLEEMHVISG